MQRPTKAETLKAAQDKADNANAQLQRAVRLHRATQRMPKRDYTLTRAAHAQRREASARAVAARPKSRGWKTIKVPADLAARIEAERSANGDEAAWRVIERALLIV